MKECIRGGVEAEEGAGAEEEIDQDGEMREDEEAEVWSSRTEFLQVMKLNVLDVVSVLMRQKY